MLAGLSALGGAAGIGGGISTIATVSSLAGSLFSAIGSIQAGNAQAAAQKSQAAQTRLELQAEKTQASVEAENRTRELRRTLASQNAIFAARGVSGGSVDVIRDQTIEDINRIQDRADTLSSTNQAILASQEKSFRQAASFSRTSGFVNAGSTLLSGIGRLRDRGSVPSSAPSTGRPTPPPSGLRG